MYTAGLRTQCCGDFSMHLEMQMYFIVAAQTTCDVYLSLLKGCDTVRQCPNLHVTPVVLSVVSISVGHIER